MLEAQQTEFVKSHDPIKLNNITMHGAYQVYYFGWLNNGTGRFLEMNHDQSGGFSFQEIDMVDYTFSGEYSWTRYDSNFNRSHHRYGTISNNAVQPPYYEDFFTGTMNGVYMVMDEPHHVQFDESWSPYGEGYTEQLKMLAERENGYIG